MPAPPVRFPGSAPLARSAGWAGLAAFTILVLIALASRVTASPVTVVTGTVVAVGAAIPLFLLRPRWLLLYAAAATAGVIALHASPGNVGWFALVVVAIWMVLSGGIVAGLIFWAGSMLVFGGEWLVVIRDPGWGNWVAGVTLSVVAAALVRHELGLVSRLRAAQDGLAERARAEERNRIARELHDVIAHSLTVSLLHVSSARLAIEVDPADALRSLAEAERLSRQSLDEVRTTMGLLRPHPGDALAPPVPGADQLDRLVEQFRDAGADVSLRVEGNVETVPATVASTVYRIVQEALTNATRHAPGSTVLVRVVVEEGKGMKGDRVEVSVDSAGAPVALHPGRVEPGLGLLGMGERAEAVGGSVTAGPGGHGWMVRASLPFGGGRPRQGGL